MKAQTNFVPKSEQKEDLYYAVHKGLRLANARMLIALGQLDASDETAVAQTMKSLKDLVELGKSHLLHENAKIHTAIEARVPGATDHAEDDHDDHERAFYELKRMAEDVLKTGTDRAARLRRLYQRFALFFADDLIHMNEEETVLQPLMEAHFSNDELAGIRQQIVSAIPPEKMQLYSRVMLPAASRPERIAMLTGMKAGMPEGVFGPYMNAVLGKAWSFGDWDALDAALS